MKVRFWKHNPPYSERFIEIEGFGFADLDRCSWTSRKLSTCDMHECDADWQPLKPVVREWVSDEWLWKENRWRKEGDGPLMYFNDLGVWVVSGWKNVGESLTAHAYEVHPGTRIPINQPLPSPPCDVVPANEAKPTAEKTELDECIEWFESPQQQAAKLSFACSMVTNGLREVNRRIDNIERRLAIKECQSS